MSSEVIGQHARPRVLIDLNVPVEARQVAVALVEERGGSYALFDVDQLPSIHLGDVDLVISGTAPLYVNRAGFSKAQAELLSHRYDGSGPPEGTGQLIASRRAMCFYESWDVLELTSAWRICAEVLTSSPATFLRPATSELMTLLEMTVRPAPEVQHLHEPYAFLTKSPGDLAHWEPLIVNSLDQPVVARYRRPGLASGEQVTVFADCLAVPSFVLNPGLWVKWWFDTLTDEGASGFGLPSRWRSKERWMTPVERLANRELIDARQALVEAVAKLEVALEQAAGRLSAATAEADAGVRRILTEDGPELEAAVAEVFELLGFEVTVMDENVSKKVEDLRLRDPEVPNWVAIVEVKGYTKGAGQAAITQINRAATAFLASENVLPSARWLVINHDRHTPPDERRGLYAGEEIAISEFAENDNGTIVDTRTLYRLLDHPDLSVARSWLRSQVGVLPETP